MPENLCKVCSKPLSMVKATVVKAIPRESQVEQDQKVYDFFECETCDKAKIAALEGCLLNSGRQAKAQEAAKEESE